VPAAVLATTNNLDRSPDATLLRLGQQFDTARAHQRVVAEALGGAEGPEADAIFNVAYDATAAICDAIDLQGAATAEGIAIKAKARVNGETIHLPDRAKDRPDRDRLALRFERFKAVV